MARREPDRDPLLERLDEILDFRFNRAVLYEQIDQMKRELRQLMADVAIEYLEEFANSAWNEKGMALQKQAIVKRFGMGAEEQAK